MKASDFGSDHGATVMRLAAEKAADAARKVMVEVVERELANDPRAPARKVGAIITACSMLYGSMLDTTAKKGEKGQAILVAGMLKLLVADALIAVAEMAGSKGGIFAHRQD